jgi:hypothetical protein
VVNPEKQNRDIREKLLKNKKLDKGVNFFWKWRFEFLAGVLMILGIILSFFYLHIGGALVGLATGIGFYDEIQSFLLQIKGFYSEHGVFKTLMCLGTILYFLISIPVFIIAVAVGFGLIFLFKRVF